MNLLDILGPVMVGPSSSHTAGAVRMGLMARALLGEAPTHAEILLHGSFAATGAGHGTDRALVAGLLSFSPDDPRIPDSFDFAPAMGLTFSVGTTVLKHAHPNSAVLRLTGERGGQLTMQAASLGGGRIRVDGLDGQDAQFTGEMRTLIVYHTDAPGKVAEVAGLLSDRGVNIATMQLYRDQRGGRAIMVLMIDQPLDEDALALLRRYPTTQKVIYLTGIQ